MEQAVTRLVETLADLEGTNYFRVQITSGTAGSYDMVIEKRTKIVRPPPGGRAAA